MFTRGKSTPSINWSRGWLKFGAGLNSRLSTWLLISDAKDLIRACVRAKGGHFEHSLWKLKQSAIGDSGWCDLVPFYQCFPGTWAIIHFCSICCRYFLALFLSDQTLRHLWLNKLHYSTGYCRFLQGTWHSEPVTSFPTQSLNANWAPFGDPVSRKLRQSICILDVRFPTQTRVDSNDGTWWSTDYHWGVLRT